MNPRQLAREVSRILGLAAPKWRSPWLSMEQVQYEPHTMQTKTFTNGRIRKADYDPESQQLNLHWDNKTVLAYKQVPQEVYRRLCSAPNPTTYWEDRIAEEYPKGTPMKSGADSDAAKKFDDLFGNGQAD